MRNPMNTCPNCGAWLDSGERCDCQDKGKNDTAKEAETLKEEKGAQK